MNRTDQLKIKNHIQLSRRITPSKKREKKGEKIELRSLMFIFVNMTFFIITY